MCPLIFIINSAAVQAINSFVQKDMRQVFEVIQAYFGFVASLFLLALL